jgi:catechol 2,3-dioxygenase-like lactoylglutathione lyase family enzyme
MISGGNATIFVSNMDVAVRFYTETLGLKLTNRFGDNWATVEAGPGLTIGLHPASARYPSPGTRGAMMLGLEIDEPIEHVVARLSAKGARFSGPVIRDEPGNFIALEDPDGNAICLWEVSPEVVPQSELSHAGASRE